MTNQLTKFFTACFLFSAVFIFSFSVDVSRSCASVPEIMEVDIEDLITGDIEDNTDWSVTTTGHSAVSTTKAYTGTKGLEIDQANVNFYTDYDLPESNIENVNFSTRFYFENISAKIPYV